MGAQINVPQKNKLKISKLQKIAKEGLIELKNKCLRLCKVLYTMNMYLYVITMYLFTHDGIVSSSRLLTDLDLHSLFTYLIVHCKLQMVKILLTPV